MNKIEVSNFETAIQWIHSDANGALDLQLGVVQEYKDDDCFRPLLTGQKPWNILGETLQSFLLRAHHGIASIENTSSDKRSY